MNIKISFNPDGTAHCLWTEALPLHELDRLEIHRFRQTPVRDSSGW
jgi:hypothetical protein